MALPFVDVASPILEAYFRGKQLRMQREEQTRRGAMEQQKFQQDNEQFKAQQQMAKDQQSIMEKQHKATLDHNAAQLDLAKTTAANQFAISKAQIANQLQQHWAQFGGAPTQNVQAPLTVDGPPVDVPLIPKTVKPFPNTPGLSDMEIDTSGIPQVPYAVQERRDRDRENASYREEALKQQDELKRAALKSQEAISFQHNETLKAIKASTSNTVQDRLTTAQVNSISKDIHAPLASKDMTEFSKGEGAYATAMAYYNQAYKDAKGNNITGAPPQGKTSAHKDSNLLLTYLQAALPSGRVTNQELALIRGADSFINKHYAQFQKALTGSVELTDNVRRDIISAIARNHKTKSDAIRSQLNAARSLVKSKIREYGVDVNADALMDPVYTPILGRLTGDTSAPPKNSPKTITVNGKVYTVGGGR